MEARVSADSSVPVRMPASRSPASGLDLVVKRSNTGLGLFTRAAIPKGVRIIEYVGLKLSADEVAVSRSLYLFEAGPRTTIDGSPRWNTARYINHSCRPNCEVIIRRRRVFIFSRRAIRAGEELNYNYGRAYVIRYLGDNCRCAKCLDAEVARKGRSA